MCLFVSDFHSFFVVLGSIHLVTTTTTTITTTVAVKTNHLLISGVKIIWEKPKIAILENCDPVTFASYFASPTTTGRFSTMPITVHFSFPPSRPRFEYILQSLYNYIHILIFYLLFLHTRMEFFSPYHPIPLRFRAPHPIFRSGGGWVVQYKPNVIYFKQKKLTLTYLPWGKI